MSLDILQEQMPQIDATPIADLSEILVARLCHDLASPLGAIGNGVELLEMMQDQRSAELQLVSASVQQATARLRLYRLAFGPVQSTQMTSAAEVRTLLRAHEETARFWTEYAIAGDLPRGHVKILLLGILCLETALAWGGTVQISAVDEGYMLRATAERTQLDPALWAGLDDPMAVPPPTAASIHFNLLARTTADLGFALRCQCDTQSITLHLGTPILKS